MRLDEEIDKLQVKVTQMGYAKELMKGSDMAGSPTLLCQVETPLSWLRLHPGVPERINCKPVLESRESEGCP